MRILLVAAAALLLASACTPPARSTAMTVPTETQRTNTGAGALNQMLSVSDVTVRRQAATSWGQDTSQFSAAIRESLARRGMLHAGQAPLEVQTHLYAMGTFPGWLGPEVKSIVDYTVIDKENGTIYFQTRVDVDYSTDKLEWVSKPEAQRRAMEGSIRDNISVFIERLVRHAETNPPPTT